MNRVVGIFIEGVQVELFNDEQIQVTSSVQNISDISKVFTDFSQSFTVPASPHNNAIFQHFYQSDVDASIDHNIRRPAYIEIDLTLFRRGKIQLEKSNLKNGQVESYTITFYGDLLALKDIFKEDKLKDLDFTNLEFAFTGTEIYNRITNSTTDYDVRYPLISNSRLWSYHLGGSTIDITTNSHSIEYDELFPAVKVSKIFEAIEDKYGITFQSSFFNDYRFRRLFLWGKNTNEYQWVSESQEIDFDAIIFNWISGTNPYDASSYVSTTGNSINLEYLLDVSAHQIGINVTSKSASGTFYIDVFQDGNYNRTLTGTTTGSLANIYIQNTSGLNSEFTFKVRAGAAMTLDYSITYTIRMSGGNDNYAIISTNNNVISGNINLNNVMPDIKVSDFIKGVLLEFNMTCVGIEENVYQVLPLDLWYSQGALVDVTEYTDLESIDIDRVKLYRKINFKYQESESFANKNYFRDYNQQYGDLSYQFDYDGDEYNIESPFENLLFQRATDTMGDYAILGYALNESYNAYTPKPCLLYFYGSSDTLVHNIKFYNGSSNINISSYALFGQDLTYQNTKYSLNFGADNSIIHAETINNGLYATYYFPYLINLFNLKQRLVTIKTILPVSLLTNLRLNDRLIIRDKRYIINDMKSNLTTGEVNFTLYLDFRPLIAQDPINPSPSAQCIDVNIPFPNNVVSASITCATAGVTITPSSITENQIVEVCIPANPNTISNILAENTNPIITEIGQNLITEESAVQVIELLVTYTYSNGSVSSTPIIITQE